MDNAWCTFLYIVWCAFLYLVLIYTQHHGPQVRLLAAVGVVAVVVAVVGVVAVEEVERNPFYPFYSKTLWRASSELVDNAWCIF